MMVVHWIVMDCDGGVLDCDGSALDVMVVHWIVMVVY